MFAETLSHYRILEKLGAGGMGEVYQVEDAKLGRKVALKILPENIASDKERLRRFEQEARAASGLNHPNILTVFEFGFEAGVYLKLDRSFDDLRFDPRFQGLVQRVGFPP